MKMFRQPQSKSEAEAHAASISTATTLLLLTATITTTLFLSQIFAREMYLAYLARISYAIRGIHTAHRTALTYVESAYVEVRSKAATLQPPRTVSDLRNLQCSLVNTFRGYPTDISTVAAVIYQSNSRQTYAYDNVRCYTVAAVYSYATTRKHAAVFFACYAVCRISRT